MIASRVLLRSPLATVARRAVAVSSVRATAVRSYSSQAAPSGGAGKSLFIAALAAGAGAAGYHFYAESQSKSSFPFAHGYNSLSLIAPRVATLTTISDTKKSWTMDNCADLLFFFLCSFFILSDRVSEFLNYLGDSAEEHRR